MDSRRESYGINSWGHQMVAGIERERGEKLEREERAALSRKTEIDRKLSNYEGVIILQGISFNREIDSRMEPVRVCENIEEALGPVDREKRINQRSSRYHEMGTWRECTEGDSEYPHRTRQKNDRKSEKEEEKGVLRASGIVIEHPIGSAREGELEDCYIRFSRRRMEYTDPLCPQDPRSEEEYGEWTTEGTTSGEINEQAEQVEEDWGRQTSEPWNKSSMEKSPVPNLTRGEKTQTRISGNNGDDKQLFIPLGGGIEGRSGEAHTGVGGEVVQSDIHGDKEERKVEKDTRLQGAKRGSAGKTLQDGFPGDSGGTPGEERLDDHSGHIECIPTCQSGRAIQSLSVLQLSKSMLC